jgi:hypothetical protein
MLQRGLYYAASTIMICAIGAASLQLAVQILSLSSPLADAAAILAAAAILVNSLRRRMRTAARHHPVAGTHTASSEVPAISAGAVRRGEVHHPKTAARPVHRRLEPRRPIVAGRGGAPRHSTIG